MDLTMFPSWRLKMRAAQLAFDEGAAKKHRPC